MVVVLEWAVGPTLDFQFLSRLTSKLTPAGAHAAE
jgi:hypothetical protein